MPLTIQQYAVLEKSVQKINDSYFKQKKDYIPEIFKVSKSSMSRELHVGVGAMAQMEDWNGSVAYDDFSIGYEKEYRHSKKSKGLQIEKELVLFKQFAEIENRVNNVNYAVHKRLQNDCASVFNNAFTASTPYLGGDSKPLCSATHQITGRASDKAQSNIGTSSLSYDNLNNTLVAMRSFHDDRGDIMDIMGNCVIVGANLEKTVRQLLGSEKEAYVGDNQKNIYNEDGISYIINPYISGNKWFVANKEMMKNGGGLNWFWAEDPRSLQKDSDFDSEVLKWKSVGNWSFGWDNWCFIYGHNPA